MRPCNRPNGSTAPGRHTPHASGNGKAAQATFSNRARGGSVVRRSISAAYAPRTWVVLLHVFHCFPQRALSAAHHVEQAGEGGSVEPRPCVQQPALARRFPCPQPHATAPWMLCQGGARAGAHGAAGCTGLLPSKRRRSAPAHRCPGRGCRSRSACSAPQRHKSWSLSHPTRRTSA